MVLWLDSGRRRKRACNTSRALYNQRWRRRRIGPAMHFRFRRRHGRRLIGNRRSSYRWAAVFFVIISTPPAHRRIQTAAAAGGTSLSVAAAFSFTPARNFYITTSRFPAPRPPAHRRQRYQIHITPAAGATVAQGKSSAFGNSSRRGVIDSRRARRSVIGVRALLQHVGFQRF